jgi:hypothetical protein
MTAYGESHTDVLVLCHCTVLVRPLACVLNTLCTLLDCTRRHRTTCNQQQLLNRLRCMYVIAVAGTPSMTCVWRENASVPLRVARRLLRLKPAVTAAAGAPPMTCVWQANASAGRASALHPSSASPTNASKPSAMRQHRHAPQSIAQMAHSAKQSARAVAVSIHARMARVLPALALIARIWMTNVTRACARQLPACVRRCRSVTTRHVTMGRSARLAACAALACVAAAVQGCARPPGSSAGRHTALR